MEWRVEGSHHRVMSSPHRVACVRARAHARACETTQDSQVADMRADHAVSAAKGPASREYCMHAQALPSAGHLWRMMPGCFAVL